MDNCPMVSIVIPVFNGGNYLREAISSALSQTYPNIEILVINDGSSDKGKTRAIALAFGSKVRYYEKENGGVSTALNQGIKEMKGEYFSWLSHDDRYKPTKISDQMHLLNHLEDKTTIIYGGYDLINEKGEAFFQVNPGGTWSKQQLERPLFPVFKGLINGCTLLIHKSHFERVGVFSEHLLAAQDIDLWFRMFKGAHLYYQYEINVETRIHEQRGTAQKGVHEEEINSGWIRRMHSVTAQEMKATMDSPENFYKGIMEALACFENYKKTYKEAERLYKIYCQHKAPVPLVSVIIPFYNRVELLLKCVKSVMNQSYKKLEILIIDDGSMENLSGLLQLVRQDKRIKLISQAHQGAAAARNRGILESKGEYIAFLDSDDLFLPNKIERQLQFMMKKQLVFSHTSYKRVDERERTIEQVDSASMRGIVFPQILNLCVIATSTVMIKRVALQNMRFTEGMEVGEDICLWIDLAYHYELGGIGEGLSLIRVGGKTTFYDKDKVRRGHLNILNYIYSNKDYLKEQEAVGTFLDNFSKLFTEEIWKDK